MKMITVKSMASLLLIAVLLVLSSCDTGTPATAVPSFNGEMKFGTTSPYTGDTADGGIQIMQGAELAAAEWNDKGGLLGKKITFVALDDAASADKGKLVASQLASDKVVAVIGHKDSGVSIPASAIYNQAGIIMITPTSSNPALTAQGFKTVFRVCPVDSTQGPYLADFLVKQLGKKKIAVVYADTAYGMGLREQFEKRLTELGITPLTSQQIHRGDRDFTAQLQVIAPLQPEVVMYAGSVPEAIIVAQQMKELGIKATMIGGDTLFQREFIRDGGGGADGAYVSSFFPDPLQNDSAKDWVERYRDMFKRNPGGNSFGGYVAATSLFEAIKRANSTDSAAVEAALRNLQMDSYIGPIAFDANGDLVDQRAHLKLFQVKNGEFMPVTVQ